MFFSDLNYDILSTFLVLYVSFGLVDAWQDCLPRGRCVLCHAVVARQAALDQVRQSLLSRVIGKLCAPYRSIMCGIHVNRADKLLSAVSRVGNA